MEDKQPSVYERPKDDVDGEIIIIGTAHVSKKSIKEVEDIIRSEKPQAIAVELDIKRYLALIQERKQDISIIDVIKRGEAHLLLFQLLLSYFQKKIGKEYGVRPGDEMLVAINLAKEIGAEVILIDRDITITFKRFWDSLSLFEKIKLTVHLIAGLFFGESVDVDKMLEEDVLASMVKEFEKVSPSAAKVLIDERDAFMALNLLNAMKKYDKIVAIVGAGHKNGIMKYISGEKKLPNFENLLKVKEKRFSLFKVMAYFLIFIILFLFVSIISTLNTQLIITAFIYWFLINGILSAVGAAIAGGHPLSILSAFLFAWLTSLNPAIAAGWISGIVEAWIRKPTSSDLEGLTEAETFRDLMKNKIFKILLVVALTNVGSMIGTFLGLYFIIQITGVDIASELNTRVHQLFTLFL